MHVLSQSSNRALLSCEILRRYAALLYCTGYGLASMTTVDLTCFQGNGPTSRVRRWHGTYWQRTRATIKVKLLGWEKLRRTPWLLSNSSKFIYLFWWNPFVSLLAILRRGFKYWEKLYYFVLELLGVVKIYRLMRSGKKGCNRTVAFDGAWIF